MKSLACSMKTHEVCDGSSDCECQCHSWKAIHSSINDMKIRVAAIEDRILELLAERRMHDGETDQVAEQDAR